MEKEGKLVDGRPSWRLEINADQTVKEWLGAQVDGDYSEGTAFGVYNPKGELEGAVMFYEYRKTDIMVAVAGSVKAVVTAMRRGWVNYMFGYAFKQLGVRRITAFIDAENKHSLRITKKFGFVEEGRMRCATLKGNDGIILGLLKSEYYEDLQ